jgi:hypothetical protein
MTSALDNLAGSSGPLRREVADRDEYLALVRSGLVRLNDAERIANSIESRFDLAYNAAHALCLAALRHSGYRSSNRYVVFQVLPHTLGLGPEVWRVLAKAHEIRNRSEYEGDLSVTERIVSDLVVATRKVALAIELLDKRG